MPLQSLRQDIHPESNADSAFRGETRTDRKSACGTYQPARDRPDVQGQSLNHSPVAKKKAECIAAEGLPQVEKPVPGDVTEIDELCVRFSGDLWLWLAVSRKVKTVLGFVFSDRSDASLERLMSEEVPPAFWDLPSCSDGWGAYRRLLPKELHTICSKGSGKTSIVEGLNTKWRQRQSGLVRKSCGVSWRILDDLFERFLILVSQHNEQCLKNLGLKQA